MWKKGAAGMLVLCLLLAGCAWTKKDAAGIKPDSGRTKTKLTIWLDGDNEYEVRNRIRQYASVRENSLIAKAGIGEYCLDIQWELVEKNYLSPKQYRQELARALENGEGPDIIYMDTYNGVDPAALIKSGTFADLGDLTSRWEAAAVNAASEHVEEAVTALSMFQLRDLAWAPDIPVLEAVIDGICTGSAGAFQDTGYGIIGNGAPDAAGTYGRADRPVEG